MKKLIILVILMSLAGCATAKKPCVSRTAIIEVRNG